MPPDVGDSPPPEHGGGNDDGNEADDGTGESGGALPVARRFLLVSTGATFGWSGSFAWGFLGACVLTGIAGAAMKADRVLASGGKGTAGLGHMAAFVFVVATAWVAARRRWIDPGKVEMGVARHGVAFVRGFVEGAALLVVFLAVAQAVSAWVGWNGIESIVRIHERVYGFRRIFAVGGWRTWPWAYVLTIPIEEILFRGVWYGWIARHTQSALAPVLGQAVVFAAWHSVQLGFPQPEFVVFGIIYGELRRIHGTIAAPLGFHFGWNATLVALIVLWPD